jgi:hypothetical protein
MINKIKVMTVVQTSAEIMATPGILDNSSPTVFLPSDFC